MSCMLNVTDVSGLSIQFPQMFIYPINSIDVDRFKEIRVQNKMSNDI